MKTIVSCLFALLGTLVACTGCGPQQPHTNTSRTTTAEAPPPTAADEVAPYPDDAAPTDTDNDPAPDEASSTVTPTSNAEDTNRLTPKDVIDGMNAVKTDVKACGNGTGIVKVKLRILESGAIESVETVEEFAGTEIGVCVENAVRKAQFPASGAPTNITFPFKF